MGFEYRLFTPAPHVSILHPTHPYIHTHITSDAFCTLVLQCVAMLLHACVAVCCNASNMTLHASYTHLAPHARMQTHPSYTTHTHTVAYTPTHSPMHPRTPPSGWESPVPAVSPGEGSKRCGASELPRAERKWSTSGHAANES